MNTSKLLWYRHRADGPTHIEVALGHRIATVPRQYEPEREREAQEIAIEMVERFNTHPDLVARIAKLDNALRMLVNIATHPKSTKADIRAIAIESRAALVE